jgi:AraC family transcriptional regulator, regulatory protein of adaptative response / DNA-3-methyladenine glycosylase II
MELIDPEVCYRALRARDARFDGRFFVAVRTTGIYCRPVCPARTPLRKNVSFFGCAAAAEEAGYRPCLRCRPETAPGTPRWDGTFATVTRALRLIDRGALDRDDVAALAADLGIGERQLRRLFAHHLGASPLAVASSRRAHEARMLLEASDLPMLDVALASGFHSLRQFNDAIRARFHATPTAIRRARKSADVVNGVARFRLPFRPPLAWDRMLDFFAARAIAGLEQVEARRYLRVFATGTENGDTIRNVTYGVPECGFFEVSTDPHGNALRLTVTGASPRTLLALVRRVRRTFDLDADPMAIAHALAQSPLLRRAVRDRPGLRIPGAWDPFEALVRGVVGQQVSVAAATTLCSRIVRKWGQPVNAGPGLTHAFPTADALANADLAQVGLTQARARNLSRLSARIANDPEVLSPARDLHDLIERLRALPGVGPWTAHYVALRGFHEPDAFPERDLGLLRGPGLPWAELESAMNHVRPFRAYAALHLWAMDSSEVGHDHRAVAI